MKKIFLSVSIFSFLILLMPEKISSIIGLFLIGLIICGYIWLTPYVIWSNYDVTLINDTLQYASLVDLVPLVLEKAGLPLSDYYQYILDMNEILPIRTSDMSYMDANMVFGHYEKESKYYDLMTQYYYMEYNGLIVGKDYKEELFVP